MSLFYVENFIIILLSCNFSGLYVVCIALRIGPSTGLRASSIEAAARLLKISRLVTLISILDEIT